MMVDFGEPLAALFCASVTLIAIIATVVKWRVWQPASRARARKIAKAIAISVATYMCYSWFFNTTPDGTECRSSTSSDGLYVAERCLLKWVPGGSSKYVGRLSDARTGKLLAQRTFSTTVPEIWWSSYGERFVYFSVGDSDDGSDGIALPPSGWDRLLASRPRL